MKNRQQTNSQKLKDSIELESKLSVNGKKSPFNMQSHVASHQDIKYNDEVQKLEKIMQVKESKDQTFTSDTVLQTKDHPLNETDMNIIVNPKKSIVTQAIESSQQS